MTTRQVMVMRDSAEIIFFPSHVAIALHLSLSSLIVHSPRQFATCRTVSQQGAGAGAAALWTANNESSTCLVPSPS